MLYGEYSESLDAMFYKRRTVLLGQIDRPTVDRLGRQLLALQDESLAPITMLIQSSGGATFSAMQLCDLMEYFITAPLRGVVIGNCHSAATFVLLNCGERLATPNSQFVIHSNQVGDIKVLTDQTTERNLQDLLRETTTIAETTTRFYMKKLNMSRTEVAALVARGDQAFNNALSVEEALKIGLITGVVEKKLDFFPAP